MMGLELQDAFIRDLQECTSTSGACLQSRIFISRFIFSLLLALAYRMRDGVLQICKSEKLLFSPIFLSEAGYHYEIIHVY